MNTVKLVALAALVCGLVVYMNIDTGKAPRQYKTYSKTIEAHQSGELAQNPVIPSAQSNQTGHICIGGICKLRQDATPQEILQAEQEEKDAQLEEALRKVQEAEQRAQDAEQRALQAEQRAQQLIIQ